VSGAKAMIPPRAARNNRAGSGRAERRGKAARQCLEEGPSRRSRLIRQDVPAQFLVLLTCRDEKHQIELLARFPAEGLECKALLS